jgi:ATP-dependent helicase/nuclease subunit A
MRVRVASAGTGKTTSLVVRTLHAIDEGLPLRRIAAITFTRSAAAELRERIAFALADVRAGAALPAAPARAAEIRAVRFAEAERELAGAAITTIHGFLARALRLVAPELALDPAFVRIDEGEAVAAFADAYRSVLLIASPDPILPSDGGFAAAAAWFAGRSLAPSFTPADPVAAALQPRFEAAYDALLARFGPAALAPADIERVALRLVAAPTLIERVIDRYPLLLVDEYQDVNPLQGLLLERFEAAGARVEVVGDPKQSIYAFRHADVGVFRRAAERARAAGTLEPPLIETYRHAPRIAAFLNHLTAALAERGGGFAPDEAPMVTPAAAVPPHPGAVEIHWWRDDHAPLDTLRRSEYAGVAERVAAYLAAGRRERDVAVIARSHRTLAALARALAAAGVPTLFGRGRGFFDRRELRDLHVALRAAHEPSGLPLAAYLHGPFGGLDAATAAAIVSAADPLAALLARAPAVASAFAGLRARLRDDPAGALALLATAPLSDGAPYVARLPASERDNVDALIVDLARRPPSDLGRLVAEFDALLRSVDTGGVPPSGDGVALLTVHAAKGLEWPVVVIADAGALAPPGDAPLLIDSATGAVAMPRSPAFVALDRARHRRAAEEAQRMLYVAASRAREELLISGSCPRRSSGGWLRALEIAGFGPGGKRASLPGVSVAVHAPAATLPPAPPPPLLRPLAPTAPWAGERRAGAPYPPVVSPSWLALEGAGRSAEPRVRASFPASPESIDPERFEPGESLQRFAGRATALGTLVHDAIARSLLPDRVAPLAAQEVLTPFPSAERDAILREVGEMIAGFWALVAAGEIAAPGEPPFDRVEVPFAFEAGGSVWQGVIDRVTVRGGEFVIDDYKTDVDLHPERYLVPLATYVEAVAAVHGVRGVARLIDLRRRRVIVVDDARLRRTWQRVLAGHGGDA